MRLRRCRAAWVLPVDRPPIPDGAVLLDREGRIAALGPDAEVPAPPDAPTSDFGAAAILPGLVNAHTHLELTGLAGLAPETDFPSWIRRVIALKQARSRQDFLAAARQGIRDCWAAGVTTVADTGDSGAVIEALHELGGSGIVYQEVFGPDPGVAETQFASFIGRLEELSRFTGPRIRLGVSPHAPYSVSGRLYRQVARFAREKGFPIAVHIAESAEESALLESATGPFARNWTERGIPLPSLPGRTPLAWLDEHGVLGPSTLCIHVVRADAKDLGRLARSSSAVAHCPRSNARHGHGTAPLGAMLDLGIRVGVGTDSVASAGPLDLLAEARAARDLGRFDAERALRLCTLDAALALGLGHEAGSISPGKWGDLVVFRLPEGVDGARPADTVMSRGLDAVVATYIAGREVWRSE
jgi:5-methylthioadenosine/S-adenosylhomocysteine deaminase